MLGTPQQVRAAAPAVTQSTRPPARPRKPINWRKVGLVAGIPALIAALALAVWQFWPRVLLPPEKMGTILDRATNGATLTFNDGLPGRQTLVLSTGTEIWDISTRESIYHGEFLGTVLSPDSRFVFDNRRWNIPAALYDWKGNKPTAVENPPPQWVSVPGRPGFTNMYLLVRFSNTGNLVAAARPNGSLHLLDTATGKILHTLREGSSSVFYEAVKQTCIVTSLAFTGDDSVLASGESNGNISLWNTRTGDLVATLSDQERQPCEGSAPQAEDSVFSVGFSSNGDLLASQDDYGVVRVWEVSSRKILYALPILLVGLGEVRFSPDGRFLVSSSKLPAQDYGRWLVLNAGSGRLLGAFRLPGQVAFAFLPDGSLLTAQSSEGRVRVEKWAMRSRFRIPFTSSSAATMVRSDPALLQEYEEYAIQSLANLQSELGRYIARDGQRSFPHDLKGTNEFTFTLPVTLARGSFLEELCGYRFSYTAGPADDQGRVTSYALTARPLVYRQTGTRSFRVDQTGQVHATDEPREATSSDAVFRSIQDLTQMIASTQGAAAAEPTPTAQTTSGGNGNSSSAKVASSARTSQEVSQLLSRAQNQFSQGDYSGAIRSCDAALQLNPSDARAKQLRAKIESTMRVLEPQTASSSPNITPASYFGIWNKIDPGGIIRVIIYGSPDKPRVHVLAACSPNPCDQGEEDAFWDGNRLTATFRRPPTITDYRLSLDQNANLQLNCRFRNTETKVDQPCVTMSYTKAPTR